MPILTTDTSDNLYQLFVNNGVVTTTQIVGVTPVNFTTYTVKDAMDLAQKLAKGVPFTGVDMTIANMVNAAIYKSYPWRDTLVTFGDGAVALTDAVQDYDANPYAPVIIIPDSTGALWQLYIGTDGNGNKVVQTQPASNGYIVAPPINFSAIMRMTQFSIARTDVSPVQVRELNVSQNLTVDLVVKSPYEIRAASYQGGKFRLESAVRIPSGSTWELRGEYQPHPVKLTDEQDTFWFADEYLEVFAKGLAYWAYRMSDDARMGTMQTADGRPVYTGALGEFMQAIRDMAAAEDFGNIDGYYPGDGLLTVDGRRNRYSWFYPLY